MDDTAWRAAIITVSDSRSAHGGADPSGDAIAARLAGLPAAVAARTVVADSLTPIRDAVRAALTRADLIVLTGGTGLAARDVTPQALAPLLEYEVPGMAEAMRAHGMRTTPHAMLSRQVAGVAAGRLVLALPGSVRAVTESLDAVWAALPHALTLLRRGSGVHAVQAGAGPAS